MAAVRHLGCYTPIRLDHPRRVFGLCRCANFGWNRSSAFDNMQVLLFCHCRLKSAYSYPTIFWGISPQNGEQYDRNPQTHFLA